MLFAVLSQSVGSLIHSVSAIVFGCFSPIKKLLGRTEKRSRDRKTVDRTVWDISRNDQARIATCSLRTPTDRFKANYSVDCTSYHLLLNLFLNRPQFFFFNLIFDLTQATNLSLGCRWGKPDPGARHSLSEGTPRPCHRPPRSWSRTLEDSCWSVSSWTLPSVPPGYAWSTACGSRNLGNRTWYETAWILIPDFVIVQIGKVWYFSESRFCLIRKLHVHFVRLTALTKLNDLSSHGTCGNGSNSL